MFKFKAFLSAFVFGVSTIGVLGASSAGAVSSQTGTGPDGVCAPISQTASFYVTEDQVLLSHDAGGALYTRTLATAIPAGTYDISALSYEHQHPNDPIPKQPYEQWYAELYSANGVIEYTTGVTVDVPDDTKTTTTNVGMNVEIANDITSIRYVHAAYDFNTGTSMDPVFIYNSITPSCLAFETVVVEEPVIVADPACTIVGIFDTEDSSKLTITIESTDLLDLDSPQYLVDWGDSTQSETFNPEDMMMHEYAEPGSYDVIVNVLVDGQTVATCDDPENVVESEGVTVVLGEETTATVDDDSDDEGNTAVLAATGISPSFTAGLAGVSMMIAVVVLSKATKLTAQEL